MSALILIAKIVRAHGIRGAILVHSFSEYPEEFLDYPLKDKSGKIIELNPIGMVKDKFICQIEGIKDRNQAESLKGIELFVEETDLPELEKDEVYHKDLIGLQAVDSKDAKIGVVKAVYNFGAGDILAIQSETEEILLPFTKDHVIDILLPEQKVIVSLPEWSEPT